MLTPGPNSTQNSSACFCCSLLKYLEEVELPLWTKNLSNSGVVNVLIFLRCKMNLVSMQCWNQETSVLYTAEDCQSSTFTSVRGYHCLFVPKHDQYK